MCRTVKFTYVVYTHTVRPANACLSIQLCLIHGGCIIVLIIPMRQIWSVVFSEIKNTIYDIAEIFLKVVWKTHNLMQTYICFHLWTFVIIYQTNAKYHSNTIDLQHTIYTNDHNANRQSKANYIKQMLRA